MKKLLVICGPTATGKTNLALYLAKKFKGEIVSADARQIYKYMDIGTGKDKVRNTNIFGYDLVTPDKEFSVKKYVDFAYKTIAEIYTRDNLPIVVGGTGLYIKALVDNLEKIYIPRNSKLRKEILNKSADEIFEMVKEKSQDYAATLNDSERKNKQRLVRILETISYDKLPNIPSNSIKFDSVLWIGLKGSKVEIDKRIEERVNQRINFGFEEEILFLKKKNLLQYTPSKTLGYREWIKYLDKKVSREGAMEEWKKEEKQYAKRQMTWFKKEKRINWFNITDKNYKNEIAKMVEKWYDRGIKHANKN